MSTASFNKERVLSQSEKNVFLHFIGLRLENLKKERITGKLLIHHHHKQQGGFLHGGVISTLLDTAMGFAAYTVVPDHQHVVTSTLNVSFYRPVTEGWIVVNGWVDKVGSQLVYCESELISLSTNESLAKAKSTMAITG
jgi:uncharacterized protein (TIGR00369 family)